MSLKEIMVRRRRRRRCCCHSQCSKGRNWGVDLNIISPFFDTKYFIDFYLANFKHGFMYYFSTRIQKENKKHVFDYILLFKDIVQYVQYAMTNILQWI